MLQSSSLVLFSNWFTLFSDIHALFSTSAPKISTSTNTTKKEFNYFLEHVLKILVLELIEHIFSCTIFVMLVVISAYYFNKAVVYFIIQLCFL